VKRILTEIAVVYSLILSSAFADQDALAVTHYPEAVYMGEKAAFVVEGMPNGIIRATLGGKRIASAPAVGGRVDMDLSISSPGQLVLGSDAGVTRTFLVVAPDEKVELAERDGYLFSGELPVILLAEHKVPAKHNRKWEVLRVIKGWFSDSRPTADSGLLIGASFLTAEELGKLDEITSTPDGFWSYAAPGKFAYEINGLISSAQGLERRGMALVALSLTDQERGIDDCQFRIKLEWFLQALNGRGFTNLFLLPPTQDLSDEERFPDLSEDVKPIARANSAQLVNLRCGERDFSFSGETWLAPALEQIKKRIKCGVQN
jgi:hypothetical protein